MHYSNRLLSEAFLSDKYKRSGLFSAAEPKRMKQHSRQPDQGTKSPNSLERTAGLQYQGINVASGGLHGDAAELSDSTAFHDRATLLKRRRSTRAKPNQQGEAAPTGKTQNIKELLKSKNIYTDQSRFERRFGIKQNVFCREDLVMAEKNNTLNYTDADVQSFNVDERPEKITKSAVQPTTKLMQRKKG